MLRLRPHLHTIYSRVSTTFNESSTFIRALCVLLVAGHILTYAPWVRVTFSVTPGHLFHSALTPLTLLTQLFFEPHLGALCVHVTLVLLCVGRLIHPLWGVRETVCCFLLVSVVSTVLASVCCVLLYALTLRTAYLFSLHFSGQAPLAASCAVVCRQLLPDHVLSRGPLRLTNQRLPLALTAGLLLLHVLPLGLVSAEYVTLFVLSTLVSWTYLRFYQRHASDIRGDMSEYFSFAKFFPAVAQPVLETLATNIHVFLVRVGACSPLVRKYDVASLSSISITLPAPSMSTTARDQDAERHRQTALKALNERLQKSPPSPSIEWPSTEEENGASENSDEVPAEVVMTVSTAATSESVDQGERVQI